MSRSGDSSRWLLIVLAVLLALGMLLTLWAGKEGVVRSRHGVTGQAAPERQPAQRAVARLFSS